MLTTGSDNFLGVAGNDTFVGNEVAAGKTWTVGDAIDGGAGADTFNVTQTAAITTPVGTTVRNIETVNLLSGATVTVDASGWTGLTDLNAMNSGHAQTLTAAATTNVVATVGAQAANAVAINGGNNVTVSATGGTTGTITIGGTTAATGAVTVTSAGANLVEATGNTTQTQGPITVTGGTSVNVTTTGTVSGGSAEANDALTLSQVVVNGNASTTTVAVTQTAAQARVADVGVVLGKAAIVNGAVTINDANHASTTAAGTITTVTLNSADTATINSGALTTLNLGGTLKTVDATNVALTTGQVTTLALNLTGANSTGAVTIDPNVTTLNISGNTTASILQTLVATAATRINVSGDAKVNLTNNTTAAVTDIVVTNTAGASFGTALGANVNFTGGAGADTITLANGFTKAITMGAGNDTVTVGGANITAGGSVAAGDGIDTIVMLSAEAAGFDNNATFNTKFTGFEVLRLSDALGATLDLDGLNGASKVVLAAGGAGTLNNLASGGTVDFLGNGTGTTIGVRAALLNTNDVLNLNLVNSTTVLAAGSVTAANVETINIGVADAAAAGSNAVIHTLTLAAVDATTVVVTGNNGLNLTNTGNVAITRFDASGVVGNATADTAANLAVTFASANTTATATVTITGGAGDDVLTGNAAKDIINGGAGADTIGGAAGADTINGGAGADTITGGAGVDDLTGGAGNDTFVYAIGDASVLGFTEVGGTGSLVIAPDAGDTFTGTEVIRDLITGDTLNLGNASLAVDAGAPGTLEANEFIIIQGTFTAGVFTVGAGLNTGPDSLLIYDADATAGVQQAAIVLVGVTSAEEGGIVNATGVLSAFGA